MPTNFDFLLSDMAAQKLDVAQRKMYNNVHGTAIMCHAQKGSDDHGDKQYHRAG